MPGIRISLLALCIFLSSISYSQSTASQSVTSFVVKSSLPDSLKKIWVYLPKGYSKSQKAYSVTYMFDGQNIFDAETSYVGEWKVDEFLDNLDSNNQIVVGIAHGNEKRIAELTPFKHPKYGGGQGDDFLKFLILELKPLIDQKYRTLKDSDNTSIIGSSLGGLMAFYAVLTYPDVFSKAGVFSPAFWINPEIFELAKSTNIPSTSKFYFLAGTKEGEQMVPDLKKMYNILTQKGLKDNQISKQVIEGAEHNEAFWSSEFSNAYQWLFTKN